MVDSKSLLKRARRSAGGEAYASIAKAPGFRVGVGARMVRGRDPSVFVEIVLDPFPERPRVNPGCLANEGEIIAQLEARGYAIACDEDNTVTCERPVDREGATREVREVLRMLESPRGSSPPRRAASRRT